MLQVPCVCLTCSAPFTVKPYVRQRGGGKYCSQPCYRQRERSTIAERFWSYVLKADGCWLWQRGQNGSGYGVFSLTKHEDIYAHRFAYEMAYGLILPGLCVCHHCDTPACVRPEHMFLGTKGDNLRDMVRKQRHGWRTKPERAKLTEAQVREMRRMHADTPMPYPVLARTFGVSTSTIHLVIRKKIWAHVL